LPSSWKTSPHASQKALASLRNGRGTGQRGGRLKTEGSILRSGGKKEEEACPWLKERGRHYQKGENQGHHTNFGKLGSPTTSGELRNKTDRPKKPTSSNRLNQGGNARNVR